MRSPGSWWRAVGLSALILWSANALWPRSEAPALVDGSALADALPRFTVGPSEVVARLDHVPDARERDWLAALRDAGASVRWSGDIAPVAMETYAAVDPAGGAFILASAAGASTVADGLGPIGTLEAGRMPALVRVGDVRGGLTLTSGREVARTSVDRGIAPRRVIVVGEASWEAKFLIAALEETGWHVDARLRVRPDRVVQGAMLAPDTARHSAVVLLDTSVRSLQGLEAFVRAGGGLLLAGQASRSRVATPLIAWRVARRETAPLGVLPDDTLWRGLSRASFESVDTARAIVLERRGDRPVLVARRHYAGRVLAVGYDETWRWRLAGGANSVAEHRAWWSRHVASVALRPAQTPEAATGAAPLAALYSSLGPPASSGMTSRSLPRAMLANVLGAIVLAALLADWLLRRLRGDR